MASYQDLLTLRENLKKKLAEVESDIRKYDLTIYKGKLEKAIKLLEECEPLLHSLIVIDSYVECGECGNEVNIEIYLSQIIADLSIVATHFEKLARIP